MRKITKENKAILSILLCFVLAVPSSMVYAKSTVRLNKKSTTIQVGKTVRLKVNGTKKKVSWSSSNKKVATVTNKGKVKGIKAGKAIITAKVEKKKLSCKVVVKNNIVKATATPTTEPVTKTTPNPTVRPTRIPETEAPIVTTALPMLPAKPTPTIRQTSVPTATPSSSLTPTSTVLPTDEPVSTPNVKYQENITSIKRYIIKNGDENSSGNKFIKITDNITESDGQYYYQYAIVYEHKTSTLKFITILEAPTSEFSVTMYLNTNKNLSPDLVLISDSGMAYRAIGELDMETYTEDTDIYFETVSGNVSADIQNMSNICLRLSFNGWDWLLSKKLNMRMKDIGFVNYN